MKNLLVISMNSFSSTRNNGKTLNSLIDSIDHGKITVSQLYFQNELPDVENEFKYFRITDLDILKKILGYEKQCGKIITSNQTAQSCNKSNNIPRNSFTLLLRELCWKNHWLSEDLEQWLGEVNPDVILLLAGDILFSYDICDFIVKKYNTKLIIYITDDYIDHFSIFTPLNNIHQVIIKKKMKYMVSKSDILMTISEKMKKRYEILLKKDSILYMNSKAIPVIKKSNNQTIKVVYAGGLHLNRIRTLKIIVEAINRINLEQRAKVVELVVYSNSELSEKTLKKLNKDSKVFYGQLKQTDLMRELNKADILLHIESYDKRTNGKIKYSVSTKILECLSLGKPIFAAGPINVASMELLTSAACCAYAKDEIYKKLLPIVLSKELRDMLGNRSNELYEKISAELKVTISMVNTLLSN